MEDYENVTAEDFYGDSYEEMKKSFKEIDEWFDEVSWALLTDKDIKRINERSKITINNESI